MADQRPQSWGGNVQDESSSPSKTRGQRIGVLPLMALVSSKDLTVSPSIKYGLLQTAYTVATYNRVRMNNKKTSRSLDASGTAWSGMWILSMSIGDDRISHIPPKFRDGPTSAVHVLFFCVATRRIGLNRTHRHDSMSGVQKSRAGTSSIDWELFLYA